MRFDDRRTRHQARAEAFDEAAERIAWFGRDVPQIVRDLRTLADIERAKIPTPARRACDAALAEMARQGQEFDDTPPDTIHTYQNGQRHTYEAGDDWPAQDGGID